MKNLTLIANSGIQFYSFRIRIDWDTPRRLLFHQYFDDEMVENTIEYATAIESSEGEQFVVKRSDLTKHDQFNPDGSIKTPDSILSQPTIEKLYMGDTGDTEEMNRAGLFELKLNSRNCKARKHFLNVWLPLPFHETGVDGKTLGVPNNWCRIKFTPTEEENVYDALIAFDTHTIYDTDTEFGQCPFFSNAFSREKKFSLSSDQYSWMAFFSANDGFVNEWLRELVYPGMQEIDIEEEFTQAYKASYILLLDYLVNSGDIPTVTLFRDRGSAFTGVEMAIDMGNSRTSAVIFENGDFTKARALKLHDLAMCTEGSAEETSFDMRLAFDKVSFGNDGLHGSHQFVWPSLVRLGHEADRLTRQAILRRDGLENLSTYSSPKRYLWDLSPAENEWELVTPDTYGSKLPVISGFTEYIGNDGRVNDSGMSTGYHYSRCSLMTFIFNEILLHANMQINSHAYRSQMGNLSSPRRIDKIVLTCPTAMSRAEQTALHHCLSDAVKLLNNYYERTCGTPRIFDIRIIPDLAKKHSKEWIFDEATCAQFVYLYGQIHHRYINKSADFFNLYGKPQADGADCRELTVGSLDIGAGTSDVTICKYTYSDNDQGRLKPVPIYWDSFNYAGDDMVKVLVESILLGQEGMIARYMKENRITGLTEKTFRFFGQDHSGMTFNDKMIRRDFNLQINVPIVYRYLQMLADEEEGRVLSFDDIFASQMPSQHLLDAFSEVFGFDFRDIRWEFNPEKLSRLVENIFEDLLKDVAMLMHIYKCDIVLLSGRPTSLQPIKNIFLKYFAVSPEHLVILNKFRIGRWYPFITARGYLNNSKTVVPVGAMIAWLASTEGMDGFSLDLSELGSNLKPTTDFFYKSESTGLHTAAFITPTQSNGEIQVTSLPAYISTKQFDIPGYPIRPFYELSLNMKEIASQKAGEGASDRDIQLKAEEERQKIMSNTPLTVRLTREDFPENKERLTIEEVTDREGNTLNRNMFRLEVRSLDDPSCYWLDSGAFNLNI